MISFRSSPPEVFSMEGAPKNEVIPQENTNTEARPQQSRFAALLKSHPCTDYIYIYIYIYIYVYILYLYISVRQLLFVDWSHIVLLLITLLMEDPSSSPFDRNCADEKLKVEKSCYSQIDQNFKGLNFFEGFCFLILCTLNILWYLNGV